VNVEPWLLRAARAHPERAAVETPHGALTYAELERAAGAGAAVLAPGERVAIALPPGLDFAIALHACLRAGAVAVPVDMRLGAAEQARIAAGARLLDEPLELERSRAAPPWQEHDLDAPAVVIHTSGTSAAPKPVVLSYGNWLWSALGSATALGLDPGERWLSALPLAHVGGLSVLIRSAIYGTTAIVHERFNTDATLAALNHATLVSLVPTTLARLLDAGLREPPMLRCALIGGAPVPPALLARAREAGVPVSQTYGLTEACSQVTTQPPGDGGEDAGPPLFCTRLRVEDGEIVVAGPTVAAEGWLRTGDLGELRDGRLRVSGRKSDTIVSGGENIAPAEVEAVLAEHAAVSEAAVIGVPHAEWGEALRAIVVLAGTASAEELRAHCAARLARFKVPKEIVFTDGPLPRTPSGKLLRRELR
jgi:O-succinylbenzoic acid--CoA ligase